MYAAWSGKIETVKILISKGADTNAKDSTGYTPLMWASDHGYLDIAKLLIDKGSDINAQDVTGATVLHYTGSLMVTQYLLDRSADTTLKNVKGWTALRQSVYDKNIGKVALIRKKTNWQEENYPLTSEEIRGRSVYEPEKDMFDVPSDEERAYKLATYDCNAMIFKNVGVLEVLSSIDLYGLPSLFRVISRAFQKEELFQKCMTVMGFKRKNNWLKDYKPSVVISGTPFSKTTEVPAQNKSNVNIIDYSQYSKYLVLGKTTKQDVLRDLGQPIDSGFDSGGKYECWEYLYRTVSSSAALGEKGNVLDKLILEFDNKGILRGLDFP
jgi:hypothetical protein